MKHLLWLLSAFGLMLASCSKDEAVSYPKLYRYTDIVEEDGGAFVFATANTLAPLPGLNGDYANFVDSADQFLEYWMREILFFEEFELLSESMLRFKAIADQQPFDTTVAYTLNGEQLVIGTSSPYYIRLSSDRDEIRLCNYIQIGIRGPNPPVSGLDYGINLGTCESDFQGHLEAFRTSGHFVQGDTLGLYILEARYQ